MIIRNGTEFCQLVENTLGWEPDETLPPWKVMSAEVGKLKRKMATKPKLYTWENLTLAAELLRRERKTVTSPAAVCWHVERAIRAANQTVTSDIVGHIHAAVTEAFLAGEPEWVERLARAIGDGRYEVLEQWKAFREGASDDG